MNTIQEKRSLNIRSLKIAVDLKKKKNVKMTVRKFIIKKKKTLKYTVSRNVHRTISQYVY